MFWLTITWGFEGMAGGVVVSIPKFREDFGEPYMGQYIVDANWQLIWLLAGVIRESRNTFLSAWVDLMFMDSNDGWQLFGRVGY